MFRPEYTPAEDAFRAELRAWASVCLIKTIYLMA
jgi:hypothetical protein